MKTRHSDGFTLIEVMIVVLIIAALATMVLPNLMDIPDRMKSQIALGDIKSIETALKVYRLETGSFPRDLNSLTQIPTGVGARQTPYLEKKPDDPWRRPYQYRYPTQKASLVGFDLYSVGPNGIDDSGEQDDIANWKNQG